MTWEDDAFAAYEQGRKKAIGQASTESEKQQLLRNGAARHWMALRQAFMDECAKFKEKANREVLSSKSVQANELILEREDLARFKGQYKPDTFHALFMGDRCDKCNRVYEQFVMSVDGKDTIEWKDTVSKKTVQPNEITELLLREFLQVPYNPT
jgi:hypothetical protein